MPVIHREAGLVFRFFSNENNEPAHVHVYSQTGSIKIWVPSCEIARVTKISISDQRRAMNITAKNKEVFFNKWNEFKKRENF